ncbi:hypothetical protein QO179_24260 [Bacillus stercoris]|nr:hypothetical protein [Bacillus stercoris]
MNRKIGLEDIVAVPVKCIVCEKMGSAPTLKHIIEDKETFLAKRIEEVGYIDVTCNNCEEKPR